MTCCTTPRYGAPTWGAERHRPKTGPFTLQDALQAGLDRWHLDSSEWRRVGPSVYAWAGLPDSPQLRLQAARLRLPPSAVFTGLTAAWLHGLDVRADEP